MLICLSKCVEYITFLLHFLDFIALGIYNYSYNFIKERCFDMEAIKRHPRRVKVAVIFTILIILFFIICLFLEKVFGINCFKVYSLEEEQQIFLFNVSLGNYLTILTFAGMIIGGIWALIQYDKNSKVSQQAKASEIAKSFADTLTLKCMLICNVYEYSPLGDLLDLKNKDCFAFNSFTPNEIRTIYEADNFLDKYKTLKSSLDLDTIYYNILESRISVKPIREIVIEHKTYTNKQARNLFILDNEKLPFKFDYLVQSVLNELEYLCMSLASQAAGSSYVYQSLHQVFLRTIRVLAVEIALSNNSSYSDKYFTNIIEVYNQWKALYSRSLKSERKVKKKVEKILNPKIKTV